MSPLYATVCTDVKLTPGRLGSSLFWPICWIVFNRVLQFVRLSDVDLERIFFNIPRKVHKANQQFVFDASRIDYAA